MHSLYRIVVGASQYVQSAVKLMMKTVSYQWVYLACPVIFALLIATAHVNQFTWPVTIRRCKIGRKVFWTMDNVLELM